MLKISQVEPVNHSNTLRLEGRLIGLWVEELRQVCEPLLSNGNSLKLDLAEVSFADGEGVELLARLRSRGTKLLNATPFVAEQLKSASSAVIPPGPAV
ncbi:MAG: STAS domain-containing protein [Verrucomicrobia bacterium]|nr:STAS domain-containing protein [Verrucomicrobiota bacterium]